MSNSYTTSIHKFFDETDWNYDDLKRFLEEDASSVNERGPRNLTPLHRVLENKSCNPDVIRLLIHHGANVNLDYRGLCPLHMLWLFRYDNLEGIIRALIEGGSDMNLFTPKGESLLCIALCCYDVNIIIMLIEAGTPLNTCQVHESTVHCFVESLQYVDLHAHLLRLLIEKCRGNDLNVRNRDGKSLLCLALTQFPGFDIFNFMLESGCSWKSCKYHDSPWQCATDCRKEYIPNLTRNFVQMLIDGNTESNFVNDLNEDLLNCSLRYCSYEISAIQLMFDKGVVQMKLGDRGNALHSAFSNKVFNMNSKIVKVLVDRGADINALNIQGYTPLHSAIDFFYHFDNLSAVKALLKLGPLVNVLDKFGETPLKLALMNRYDEDVLQLLLNFGARVDPNKWCFESLSYALGRYIGSPFENHLQCCKLLIKHSLLDDFSIDITPLISESDEEDFLVEFVKECRDELRCMNTVNVSQHCTLYELIVRRNEMKMVVVDNENFNINQLLNVLVHNKFPAYFDVICSTIDREDMKPKLREIVWYAVDSDPETQANSEIRLDCDSVLNIASYLSDEDLMKLIICSKIL